MRHKVLAVLLILTGLAIACYPSARDFYYEYQQQKITAEWLANLEHLDSDPVRLLENEAEHTGDEHAVDQTKKSTLDLTKEMEGLLIIDRINLKIPILTGVTERNLNLAVASVENSGKPGEIGNYVIAGHNSRSYGLLFNRLDELAPGDEIVVEGKDSSYIYEVTERLIVKPEDSQVLLPEGSKRQITLVTCDYSTKPYLRLIVKGELKS